MCPAGPVRRPGLAGVRDRAGERPGPARVPERRARRGHDAVRCQEAENALGRVRTERWGPRTLDVDVIVYGTEVSDDPELTLPHPRAHERAFVLAPWHDVDPGAVIPGRGRVADLLAAVGTADVRLCPDATLRGAS
jgi:hypothetical protein